MTTGQPPVSSFDAAGDPVCGKLVTITSEFRADYYGKDVYFCSEQCLDLFMKDPDAYEGEGTVYMSGGLTFGNSGVRRVTPPSAGGSASTPPAATGANPVAPPAGAAVRATAPPPGGGASATAPAAGRSASASAPPAAAPDPDAESDLTIPPRPGQLAAVKAAAARAAAARTAAGSADDESDMIEYLRARDFARRRGPFGWFLGFATRRKEARAITRSSKQMLAIFQRVSAGRSKLERHECYRQTVIEHLGHTESGAERLLAQARASFATWPRPRALTLRDTIHFVSVLEYRADHPESTGLEVDAGKIVESLVPAEL